MMRWKALLSKKALAIFAVLLLAAGGLAWKLTQKENLSDRYLTSTVERASIEENVTAVGTLQPLQFVDVGTQVTGQLKKLHVNIGDIVEKGGLLAEIDPTLLQARVEGTRATIRNLTSQAEERRAQLELTAAQHARNRTLFEADAASADAFQQSAAAEKTAAAQVAGLRAQIEQARSTLTADEANLRYTKIYAPMAGTVVSLTAREGQTLVASQQAPVILRVADLKTMTVSAQVSEADVPKVSIGMPSYFTTLGMPERRWEGKVRQLLPTPEVVNNVVLYNVQFDVDNSDGALKPQMSAQVYFVLARADDVLVVPAAALQARSAPRARSDAKKDSANASSADPSQRPGRAKGERRRGKDGEGGGRKRVYLVRVIVDGKVEEREVTVGVTNRTQAEVLSGLNEGDVVVVGVNEAKGKPKGSPAPLKKGKL